MENPQKGFGELFRKREIDTKTRLNDFREATSLINITSDFVQSLFYLIAYYKNWDLNDYEIDIDFNFGNLFSNHVSLDIQKGVKKLLGSTKNLIIPIPNYCLLYKKDNNWSIVYLVENKGVEEIVKKNVLRILQEFLSDSINLTRIEIYPTLLDNNLRGFLIFMYIIAVIQFSHSDIVNSKKVLDEKTFERLIEKMKSLYELRHKVDPDLAQIKPSQANK